MLRIIGLQRSEDPQSEFVLLQNQGHLRIRLRGHGVLSETTYLEPESEPIWHLFHEEESIPAGMFVMLVTGCGEPAWGRSRDGSNVYHTFMNSASGIWIAASCPLHVLSTCHSYVSRTESAALRLAVV
jgi:hypothetical protein